ncbi:MAG: DUF4405 domain-containing protein [Phycisphaerales bacterium]|nr:DUF4405 domain-containing protein [Phycisphaerales bacterium]
MTHQTKRKRLNLRSFISFLIALSMLLISFSGIILYLTPQGRIAHWTNWTMLGLDKDAWTAVHMNTCLLFVVGVSLHIYLNWRVLLSYIRRRVATGLHRRWELALATAISAIVVIGTLLGVPPTSTIIRWNDDIKAYWAGQVRTTAPIPHAEGLSLKRLAELTPGQSSAQFMEVLRQQGYDVDDASVKLATLAKQRGVSPMVVYEQMIAHPEQGTSEADSL